MSVVRTLLNYHLSRIITTPRLGTGRDARSRPGRAHSDIADYSPTLSGSAPEKRLKFSFHRYTRDHPYLFAFERPEFPLQNFTVMAKSINGAIHNLVQEWAKEWLAGVDACGGSGTDAEVRLVGMVEEVVWGNVIWYGFGGWESRRTRDRWTRVSRSTPTFNCRPPPLLTRPCGG